MITRLLIIKELALFLINEIVCILHTLDTLKRICKMQYAFSYSKGELTMTDTFKYIDSNTAYKNLFMPFPRALMYNQKYKKMKPAVKLAYMAFTDRLEYSLKNNWTDENENVYFIFTNMELQDILGFESEKTVIKIKKELEEYGLLKSVRMGLNKPNRLYLAQLDVNANEVYTPKTLDTSGTVINTVPENTDIKGTVKNTVPVTVTNDNSQTLDIKGTVKNTVNQEERVLEPKNTDSLNSDTIKNDESISLDQELLKAEINDESIFTTEQRQKLNLAVHSNLDNYLKTKQAIFAAKKKALNSHKIASSLFDFKDEDVEEEFNKCLDRVLLKVRNNEVENIVKYIYKATFDCFELLGNKRAQQSEGKIYWN